MTFDINALWALCMHACTQVYAQTYSSTCFSAGSSIQIGHVQVHGRDPHCAKIYFQPERFFLKFIKYVRICTNRIHYIVT